MSTLRPSDAVGPAAQPQGVHQQLAAAVDSAGFTRAHKLILLLVLLGVFFDVMEQNTVGLAGPSLQRVWGIGAAELGVLNSVTFASMTAGAVLAGVLGDKKGRRYALTLNLAIYTLGAVICALAPSYGILLVGRAVVGIGLGGELASAITLIAEISPTKLRGSAVALLNVGAGGIGNFVAPLFAVLVLGTFATQLGGDEHSWRWLFGLLVLPAVLIAFYRRYLPETPRYLLSRGRVDECNRVLSLLATGRLRKEGLQVTEYIESGAKLSLKPERIRFSEIFRGVLRRRTIAVATAYFMGSAAQISILTLMPTILVAQGFSVVKSVGFTAVMQAGSLAGAVTAAGFGSKLPRRGMITYGAICAMLTAVAFGTLANSTWKILLIGVVFQFFVLMLITTLWAWLPELYPTRIRAFGSGVTKSIGGLGPVVMTPIAGLVFDNWGLNAIFLLVAMLYVVMAVAARFGPETVGRSLEEINAGLEQEARLATPQTPSTKGS